MNAIAAAIAAGQTVLFASKNNQAVDVVLDRVASVSDEAAPLRAGAARYRAELARRMTQAFARPRLHDLKIAGARTEWAAVLRMLGPLYAEEARRRELARQVAEHERRLRRDDSRIAGRTRGFCFPARPRGTGRGPRYRTGAGRAGAWVLAMDGLR